MVLQLVKQNTATRKYDTAWLDLMGGQRSPCLPSADQKDPESYMTDVTYYLRYGKTMRHG